MSEEIRRKRTVQKCRILNWDHARDALDAAVKNCQAALDELRETQKEWAAAEVNDPRGLCGVREALRKRMESVERLIEDVKRDSKEQAFGKNG